MYTMLHDKSRKILDHVKAHPGQTALEIADALTATHTMLEVTSALYTLFNGRYVLRKKGEKKNAAGMALYEYTFKTDKPRMRKANGGKKKHKKAVKKVSDTQTIITGNALHQEAVKHILMTAASNDVELMIAFKGSKETVVLSVEQAKALVAQLKQLGM
jgi:hypothetical protein